MSVESEVGKGSSFYAVIPIDYRGTGLKSLPEQRAVALLPGKRPLVIIEDNPETGFIYQSYLQKTEFQPILVSSLEQARSVLAGLLPVAIILDLYLAGQNCAEYVRELRASPRTGNVPIIVISVMDEARGKYSPTGLTGFYASQLIRRPFSTAIQELTGRKERKRLLLVDDNEVSRYVLREKLAEWDFDILEVRGGREALSLIDREVPHSYFS